MPAVKVYIADEGQMALEIRNALAAELPEYIAKEVVVNHVVADVRNVTNGQLAPYAEIHSAFDTACLELIWVAQIVLRYIETEVYFPGGDMKFFQKGEKISV